MLREDADTESRREAERQVQHMALHDAPTGLPNRNMLQERRTASLGQAESQSLTMAMMFLDLDRFKLDRSIIASVPPAEGKIQPADWLQP